MIYSLNTVVYRVQIKTASANSLLTNRNHGKMKKHTFQFKIYMYIQYRH